MTLSIGSKAGETHTVPTEPHGRRAHDKGGSKVSTEGKTGFRRPAETTAMPSATLNPTILQLTETDCVAGHVDGVSGLVAAVSGPLGGCASD
jgi:hypothetical protein